MLNTSALSTTNVVIAWLELVGAFIHTVLLMRHYVRKSSICSSFPNQLRLSSSTPIRTPITSELLVTQRCNPLELKVVYKCPSPLVLVLHKDCYHPLAPPQGQLEFCFEELHDQVSKLIGLQNLSHSVADFVIRFKDPKDPGPQLIVASDAALKYALENEFPTHLEVEIKAIEVDNETNICHSSGKRTPETSYDVVKIRHDGIVRCLDLSSGELESSCEEFKRRVGDVFELTCSTPLQLSYVDKDGDTVTISKGEKLKDALSRQTGQPLRFDMTMNSSLVRNTSYVRVNFNGTRRRLFLPPDEFQFSYEKFRSSIRDLFNIAPAFQFVLSYVDAGERIKIVADEDFRDAFVVHLMPTLNVEITVMDGGGGINDTELFC